ncbi:MAG: hypothetical protein ACOC22_03285 [bacterium]
MPWSSLSGNIYDLLFGGSNIRNSDKLPNYVNYFNSQLYENFNPDITGYTMAFIVPPPFNSINADRNYIDEFQKLVCFSAIDLTPPQRQVQSEKTSARTGGVPYATGVEPSEQCSVSYLETYNLDVYNFHNSWVQYKHDLLEGYIEPSSEYLDYNSDKYCGLDYAGSLFFVKFTPSFQEIKYLGKATGIFPQTLPNKELIGQRSTNDVTVLPFNYYCAFFEESLHSETKNHPIWEDFERVINIYS